MLSPHEIATLMVIRDTASRLDIGHDELAALLRLELVSLDAAVTGPASPRLTPRGDAVLLAFAGRRHVNLAARR